MTDSRLANLGWRQHFAAQLDVDANVRQQPARVVAVHRGRASVLGEGLDTTLALTGNAAGMDVAVGDWVLVDPDGPRMVLRFERFGCFRRRSAGTSGETQVIAANVDTLFIVTSANRDFNIARLERYLAIAHDAGAYPVVVVTKADTVDSVADYVTGAARLSPGLLVEALDARDAEQAHALRSWCGAGQTVALLGSSGVGKSTLINTLAGTQQDTMQVRADDQRGRHTTTSRSMHALADGGWLIDTPGMRELQLVDVGDALDDVFAEIASFAAECRFSDCSHTSEPGCAVLAAIENGALDPERLRRYAKLASEDRRNTESLAERRARDRSLGRFYRRVMADKARSRNKD